MNILEAEEVVSVRHAIVARPGYCLLSADYSQLELRIMAHLSEDLSLQTTLNSGGDVFKAIASQLQNKDVEEVSREERQQAKEICYGIIYGIGIKDLAKRLGVVEEAAQDFRSDFLSKYTGIQRFITSCIKDCRDKGYIETLYGRRRHLPAINSQIAAKAAKAERQAINSTIQGSAADLAKLGMNVIEESIISTGLKACLILQMHDELIYEVRSDQCLPFARIVADKMGKCAERMSVVLPVNLKRGSNWGDLVEMPI
jgi:DNA polymerase theta